MVREEKIGEVERMKKFISEYPVIGLIDMFKLPSKQLQEIKKQLRGRGVLKMTKKSLLKLAVRKSDKKELEEYVPQQPAVAFTKLGAFKFYSEVDGLKSPSFAKVGDVVEKNVEIKAGPTSLLPGPVISELNKVGIPAGVEEGKIAIKKDVVVAKAGDKISKDLASILMKLKITPVEIGLNVVAIYDNGMVYTKDVLGLIKTYPDKLKDGFNNAMNMSVAIGFPTKENIKYLLLKAHQNAMGLANLRGGG